jgi:hypothetical protein
MLARPRRIRPIALGVSFKKSTISVVITPAAIANVITVRNSLSFRFSISFELYFFEPVITMQKVSREVKVEFCVSPER